MNVIYTIRGLAVLLLGLMFTQLDPGGAVVCVAANGNVSYSQECSCDLPYNEHANGCLACGHAQENSQDTSSEEASLPDCCSSEHGKLPAQKPVRKECCHNFSIDMLAATALLMPSPGSSDLLQPLPAGYCAGLLVEHDQLQECLLAALPPPEPDSPAQSLIYLKPIRLLL